MLAVIVFMHICLSSPHGACTLSGFFLLCSNNNPGAYDCLEFSVFKYGLVRACLYLTSEHLALIICFSHFFVAGARCGRMSANDPRGWGHLSYASCSPSPSRKGRRTIWLYCVKGAWISTPHVPVTGRTVTPPKTASGGLDTLRLRLLKNC